MKRIIERRHTPRVVIDSSDPNCTSSGTDTDMDAEDTVDGMPVLRTVRWRPQSTDGTEARFVNPSQARLLKSIRRKDTEGVKQQIKDLGADDVTQVEDEYAVSFLEHAVRSGSTHIVDELLSKCDTDDEMSNALTRALLFAIHDNDIKMAAHLVKRHRDAGYCKKPGLESNGKVRRDSCLNHDMTTLHVPTIQADGYESHASSMDESIMNDNDNIELRRITPRQRKISQPRSISQVLLLHDSEYSQEMTPIVMAAQLERTEIIRLLIDECCPDIHPLTEIPLIGHDRSKCYLCQESAEFIGIQSIENCRKAIEVYKALASPAYMFQAGVEDPILEAFHISELMERRKIVDPAFVDDYDAISNKCKKFAIDLLGLCRTCSEVNALLQHSGGINDIHATYHTASYPRLMVASHFNQKEFVAHPHCQQVLQNVWYNGLPAWVCNTNSHFTRVMAYVILLAITMPFTMLLYMFRIPFVDRFVRPPVNKFMYDLLTYISFLVLLFANDLVGGLHEKGKSLTVIEGLILLWLIGYTIRFIRIALRRRCSMFTDFSYHSANWQNYQMAPLLLFWFYFGLKIALFGLASAGKKFPERTSWPWYDPFLWCEAVYALACSISVMQLYTFFKVSSNLGPLQISLKAMMFDVMSFLVLFAVILSAFAIGLSSLYTGYDGYTRVDPNDQNDTVEQSDAFSSLGRTYKTLFWDIFGYGEVSDASVIVSNIDVIKIINATKQVVPVGEVVKHTLTEAMGFFLFGVYHIGVIIVLINMLIAMMANSYNRIEKNALTEWRFGRTQLIISYLNEMGVLVPPFNILPFRYILGIITKKTPRCFRRKATKKEVHQSAKNYKEVMATLSKRYWRRREALQRKGNENGGYGTITPSGQQRSKYREGRSSRA